MANQSYSKSLTLPWGPSSSTWENISHFDTSVSSPKKPSGGLDLRPNPHIWDHRVSSIPWLSTPDVTREPVPISRMSPLSQFYYGDIASRDIVVGLTNEALARFTGKVRKHNANLGVTLASWKQSSDMITDRTHKISDLLDRRYKVVEKMTTAKRRRIRVQNTASAFLEGEFGWRPLVEDISSGLGALARDPADSQWIRVSSTGEAPWKWTETDASQSSWLWQEGNESYRVTISGQVVIQSQNTFLANRLGLLNLPGVAWDLIPWSFVVNMFTNMAQMVNSLTDFCGVTVIRSSTTQSVHADIRQRAAANPAFSTYVGQCGSHFYVTYRRRTLGLPSPQFQWRVPKLNLELAAIAASLMLQKLNRLNRLVGYRP